MEVLDTDCLIALLKALDDPQNPSNLAAHALLQELEAQRLQARLALPLPVVSELLTGERPERWPGLLDYLEKRFALLELNKMAALEAALIFQAWREQGVLDDPEVRGQARQCLRTDAFILGIAIAHGCQRVYTLDKRLPALAGGRIEVVLGLPEPRQPPLL